jgi:hypothetical protein
MDFSLLPAPMMAIYSRLLWWNAANGKSVADSIGVSSGTQVDLSAASIQQDTRLAISYEPPAPSPYRIDILRIREEGGDTHKVSLEYRVPRLPTKAWVRLTNDGKYLAARDGHGFYLFQLLENQAQLVHSREDRIDIVSFWPPALDVSFDGRLAAYNSEDCANVCRIPDGESVLEVHLERCPIALSPDGRLLAVVDAKRKCICFYRIPDTELKASDRS